MDRIKAWALRISVSALLYGTLAYGQGIPASKPVWRADLGQLGLRQEHFQFAASPNRMQSVATRDSIAFGRSGHIAVAFLTQVLSRDLPSIEASREIHLVSLDAASGKVVANRVWAAPGATLRNTYVGATREGNFVVLQHDALILYSPDLQELNKVDMPAGSHGGWSLLVPPGGEFIFLERDLDASFSLRMLNARTLRELHSWGEPERIGSASGKYLARLGKDKRLYVRGFDTAWQPIADLDHCRGLWGPASLRFINEDSLVVSACGFVESLRVDGQVLFTAQLPKGHPASDVWGTTDGRFVAVAAERMRGVTIVGLDMYRGPAPWRILVYDSKKRDLVGALKFTWRHVGAFSPDGSAFALLSGGIVELFRLP
jgi:hypothetical protein